MAPEESGRLSFSITVSEKSTARAWWRKGVFGSTRASAIIVAMGPGSGFGTLEYATFVEFGTVDTPALPYMRPTWDAQARRALDYVQEHLWLEVSKSAERYAGRVAKRKAA